MTFTEQNGRLGNHIIRNIAVSFLANKHNLFVTYCNYDLITTLGINLFIGTNVHDNINFLTDDNYFATLQQDNINFNLNPNRNYFQTKPIANYIYNYLNEPHISNNIKSCNQFKLRYNNNNDVFIHVRLGDVIKFNPGLDYYIKAIDKIKQNSQVDNIYISSDSPNHIIVTTLCSKYKAEKIIESEIKTIQFGSTCKNIILSHGSFSAIIGFLSFDSNVHYCKYENNKMWYGDMFSIDKWIEIE